MANDQELSHMLIIRNSSTSSMISVAPFIILTSYSFLLCNKKTKQLKRSCPFFTLLPPTCLNWLWSSLGRRLKGAGQTKNGEEEQQLVAWGHGEREERARNKDGVFEPGHSAARAQGGKD